MTTLYPDHKERPQINYIATAAYNNDVYVYTTTRNPTTLQVTGTLTTPFSAPQCPIGSVLRANGRKLYPGGSYPGISTLMVGVINTTRGVSGFIDPNSPNFAYYNVDKSVDVPDGVNPNGGATDLGMSIYTNGNITAALGTVTVGTQLRLTSVRRAITGTTGSVTFDFSTAVGSFYTLVSTGAVSLTPSGLPPAGTIIYIQFTGNNIVTLVTPFVFTAAVNPGTTGITVGFISNGTQLVEISRTAVTTVIPNATW